MTLERKKTRPLSVYYKQILAFVDAYEKETRKSGEDLFDVAKWAIEKGLWEPPRRDPARQLARQMARASRQDYISNELGEPVRRRHNYHVVRGEKQLTFWFKIEKATPHKMKLSLQGRRNGARDDVMQAERDRRYYNAHYNPGDPIQISWNFDTDVAEREFPPDEPGDKPKKPNPR